MSSGGPNAHRAGQSGGHMEVDTPDSVKEEGEEEENIPAPHTSNRAAGAPHHLILMVHKSENSTCDLSFIPVVIQLILTCIL